MGLATYRKKRDFKRTPEPRGRATREKRGALRFVIQKHAASRLHYDFRLEASGVLKSWAVPKGPSLDPDEKRLAVQVEDHPIEYGSFEGTIPKGEYGGGSVLLWDRGTWTPDGDPEADLRRGRLSFELRGTKLRGRFSLVRMSGEEGKNWLLMKQRDDWAVSERTGSIVDERPESVASGKTIEEIGADRRGKVWSSNRTETSKAKATPTPKPKPKPRATGAKPGSTAGPARRGRMRSARADPSSIQGARMSPMPRAPQAQLATLVTTAPEGEEWIHEIKYDGYRMLCRLEAGRTTILSRRGHDWSDRLEEVAAAVSRLDARQAILDGEAVMVQPDGTTSFQALQNRMKSAGRGDLVYFAFDLLYLDGYDLTRAPLEARKEALTRLLEGTEPDGILRYSDHVVGQGGAFYAEACRRGIEGMVSKRRDAPYTAGRVGAWLKTKCSARQEFVIAGYTEPQGSRSGLGALLLGVRDNGSGLRYCGRVGTGFTRESLEELERRLSRLETSASPFAERPPASRGVHWVKPELVAEVSFGSWTDDGILRHASFEGLRDDKSPRDVRREDPATPARAARAAAASGSSARKRSPTVRRRPPETPPRRPPPVREPDPKPAVKDPPLKRRKRPVREPVDENQPNAALSLSNPDKVLYPESGITKMDLARYAHEVAPLLLPHVAGRPLMLLRCPENRERCFFQKHPSGPIPKTLDSVRIREKMGTTTYVMVRDEGGLLTLVQMGVLEIHVWGSRGDRVDQPDRIVFDLDPHPSAPWSDVIRAARLTRSRLEALGLESFPKTTGGKGIHVVVPIRRGPDWDQIKLFTGWVAASIVRDEPDRYTTLLSKERRGRRLFIDTLRNRRGSTWVAPYSTRARPGAPVSMPLDWDDLTPKRTPDTFHLKGVLESRSGRREDAWRAMADTRQTIGSALLKQAAKG